MSMEILITGHGRARIYTGRPLRDVPKTYKKIRCLYHNIGNNYNPSYLTLYKAKDGGLRYEIYRNGSIYPFYGRFEWIDAK